MQGKSIQKPDSSREEAVLELIGTRPQTFVSFSRWKKVEERMSWVRGVLDYAGCFAKAAGNVVRVNGWNLVCVMDWATYTTFCSSLQSWAEQEPYQAVIQPERMLSMVHL